MLQAFVCLCPERSEAQVETGVGAEMLVRFGSRGGSMDWCVPPGLALSEGKACPLG